MAPRRKRRAKKPRKPPPPAAYTIPEFCEAHRISRATFYNLQRAGLGPQVMDAGRKIVTATAAEWRREGTTANAAAE